MGFIERLRQQKEVEAQANFQRQNELFRRAEAEEAAREQREAQEKEFHRQRRLQAQNYFQESQVEALVTELAGIIQGRCRGYPTAGRLDHVWHDISSLNLILSQGRLPSLAKNLDSVSFGIVWDTVKKGIKKRSIPLGDQAREHGSIEKWDEFEGKFIEVETQPSGNIILHARRDIIVPEPKWKTSRDALEDALEQAYNNPRIQRYNDNFMAYHPDTGD